MWKEKIQGLARNIFAETVHDRNFLHAHPELSFMEYNTCAFVAEKLRALGIPFEKKGETGIIGLIQGNRADSERVIALRADIDALPIQEMNDVPYKSQNTGVMHACGHDVHTASLLAAAGILMQLKPAFSGTVKLIFQPGEEKLPGGASILIREGALENPRPDVILGQHVMPELEVGKAGFFPGHYMASSDEIYISVFGKGGHAAMPHLTIDPVLISCHLVTALQQIVSRRTNPLTPSVLSFGKFIADGASNVIPDKVEISGTFRTMDEEWRSDAHQKIIKATRHVVEGMGGQCNIEIKKGYPVLVNERVFTNSIRLFAEEYLGKENVVEPEVWLAAEDFAYYGKELPACFYRLGTSSSPSVSGLHTSTFDIDERALETGSGLLAYLAIKQLGN